MPARRHCVRLFTLLLTAALTLLAVAPNRALGSPPAAGDLDSLDANIVGTAVYSVAVQPDGKTIIAGLFSSVLGVARNNIARLNADGTLDAGFDPNANSFVYSVAVQTDGKILLAGSFTSLQPNGAGSATPRNFIARVNADGTLDTGFDPKASGTVYSVAVQADGKILLGGQFTTLQPNGAASATARHDIARVNADGTLDSGFDPNPSSTVLSVAVQADGKILLGGQFNNLQPNGAPSATTRNNIARVNANGTLDASFDPNANNQVNSVAVQADGNILLGGGFTTLQPNGAPSATARNRIARVNTDGTLDAGFDPNASSSVFSVAVQADGKILLGGQFFGLQPNGAASGTTRQFIARVNADGTLDVGFAPSTSSRVYSMAVQADGKILLGGGFTIVQGSGGGNSTNRNFFARVLNDAATQTLSSPDATQISWSRGGSSPEVSQVTFEQSTDFGVTWTPLGSGSRVGTTSNWQLTGLSLPIRGKMRARGRTTGGYQNGGSGLVEATASFGPIPTITLASANLPLNATTMMITGSNFSTTPGNNTLVFNDGATGHVTVATATSLTVVFDTLPTAVGSLTVVVTTDGVPSGSAVQVATMAVPGPGDLDSLDANIDGSVTASAVQPDGKTIIAGGFSSVLGVARNNIARLNADGTLDAGFDPNVSAIVLSVAVQADGKILLGGAFNSLQPNGAPSATTRNNIARVNADGTLDAGFDPNATNQINSVAVQADGKILLGGFFVSLQPNGAPSATTRNNIARVNADGTLDAGFDPNADNYVTSVVVQADGNILLGGGFTSLQPNGAPSATTRNRIARVNADGTLDAVFDPNANDAVLSMTVQADGNILIGGFFTSLQPNGAASATTRNHIARVNADGTLDAGFDPNADDYIVSMAVQADGKILLGGGFYSLQPNGAGSATARNRIARVNADGTLDAGFDPNASTAINSVAVQADGKILLGGAFTTLQPNGEVSATTRIGFARLLNDAATQTLSPPDTTQISWTRGGSSPEVSQVTFDQSTDSGVTWTPLGSGIRVGTTSNWHLTGLSLPASGRLRARGRTTNGYQNGGSGLVQATASFAFPTVTLASAHVLLNATTMTITGSNFSTTPGNNTVVFNDGATGHVTVATATSLTVVFDTLPTAAGSLTVVVTTNGVSSGAAVQVATMALPGPGDVDSLDAHIDFGTYVLASSVQPDGKTIIAGGFSSVQGVARNNIARLNADGTLDAGFDPNANDAIYSVAVQADGKILLGGYFTTLQPNGAGSATTRNRIARVNADGTVDTGFDPNANDAVNSVAMQADGTILLGGFFTTLQPNGAPSATTRNRIARVNADGTLDAVFDPNANDQVTSVAVQADGMILIGGGFTTLQPNGAASATTRNRIARVNADGTLDAGFDPNVDNYVNSVVVQADGNILLGGFFASLQPNGAASATTRNNIARVNTDGTLDAGFDPNAGDIVNSVAVQADGKILLVGYFTSLQPNGAGSATTRNSIARVNADGTLDAGFDPNANSYIDSVAVQADGKILLGGQFTRLQPNGEASASTRISLARLLNDAATQTLSAPDATQISWTRGGSSPEVSQVTFDQSTDSGVTWTPLGSGIRVGTTSNWHLTGLALTGSGQLRARGLTTGGYENGGSGLVEATASFAVGPAVTLASVKLLLNATTMTITGSSFSTTPGNNTLVFNDGATGHVTVATATTLTVVFDTLPTGAGPLTVVVTTNGVSSGSAVQVATMAAPGPGDVDSLDAHIVGILVTASAVQPDGKTIIAGSFSSVLGVARNNLARLNADGTLDAGFNPNANSMVQSVAVQADGKIVLGGQFNSLQPNGAASATTRNSIARVNADGTLDSGFDPNASGPVGSVAVQADGKILLGGGFNSLQPNGAPSATARNSIARLNVDGTLDASFDPNANSMVSSVAVQADGKILLGGLFNSLQPNGAPSATTRNNIGRVNADGTLDASFDPNASGPVQTVVVQADGKILLGGLFTTLQPNGAPSATTRNFIARLNTDGSVDAGFDPNANNPVNSMAVQADGKILLGGDFNSLQPNGAPSATARNFIARLNGDGTLDAGFDPNASDTVYSVAVQADGKVLLGGQFTTLQPNGEASASTRISFARLLNDAATQTLSPPDATQISWSRGGSSPEVSLVTFDQTSDYGVTWTPLGSGSRVGTTSNWQLTGLSLPANGRLRARGRTSSGNQNGSSGLVEASAIFGVPPAIATLSSLIVNGGILNPAFASGTTTYTAGVSNVSSITVTPVATDPFAIVQVRVNGGGYVSAGSSLAIHAGSNTVDVTITAEDGVTTLTYTTTVTPGFVASSAVMFTASSGTGAGADGAPGTGGFGTTVGTWDSIRSGMVLSSTGAIAYRGHLNEAGAINAFNYQGIWKSPDGTAANTYLLAQSGSVAPDVGSAVFDLLPTNPYINNLGQTSFVGFLRVSIGGVTSSNASGIWSELGTGASGLKLMLQQGQILGADTITQVSPTAWIACSQPATTSATAYAAFAVQFNGSSASPGSALLRVTSTPGSIAPAIVAREGDAAPGSGGTFDSFMGNSSDPRMDGAGDVAFLGYLQAGGSGIWYQAAGASSPSVVAYAGEATPTGPADTFTGFERPSLASTSGQIAFRAFLASGHSVWTGNPATPGALVAVAKTGDTAIAGMPGGLHLNSIWSPFSNASGKVAFRVSLLGGAGEPRAIVTDTSGTLTVIANVGDAAPGLGADTFANFDHPVIGDGNQVAFTASTAGGVVGLWKQAAGGGALSPVLKVGDVITSAGVTKAIAAFIVIGTATADRLNEVTSIDAAGHVLVYVTFSSGETGILLTAP